MAAEAEAMVAAWVTEEIFKLNPTTNIKGSYLLGLPFSFIPISRGSIHNAKYQAFLLGFRIHLRLQQVLLRVEKCGLRNGGKYMCATV